VFGFSTLGVMETHGPGYLRFAALGDSSTFGLGDPVAGGWRAWARLLAEAFSASAYDVSFCNVAIPGATAGSVLRSQVTDAVAHRPDLAALVVGVNDVLKSTWDAGRVRDELFACADALTAEGATLLTARFHDHAAVLPLPSALRRPLRHRIDQLNAVWDDVHAAYGGLRVDLSARPEPLDRSFWSVDRMHPSELGHRCLARAPRPRPGTVGRAPRVERDPVAGPGRLGLAVAPGRYLYAIAALEGPASAMISVRSKPASFDHASNWAPV
jgi:lysophospholipase L1-like esterase